MKKLLKKYLDIIDKHADHFCKPENRGQLEWAMWRWTNTFYAARSCGVGYDDSILYFMDGYMNFKCTDDQLDKIQRATSAHFQLAPWGYVPKHYIRSHYMMSTDEINKIENGDMPEYAKLVVKENKTWRDWIDLKDHKDNPLRHGDADTTAHMEKMYFTYYSGFSFRNGYLVSNHDVEHDIKFVYRWRDVPQDIMDDLRYVLDNPIWVDIQNKGKSIWEDDMCDYFARTLGRHVEHILEKGKKLSDIVIDAWYKIEDIILSQPLDEAALKKMNIKELDDSTYLGIHDGNIITQVTKDCHQSYIDVAVRICNEILANPKETAGNKDWAKTILDKLK